MAILQIALLLRGTVEGGGEPDHRTDGGAGGGAHLREVSAAARFRRGHQGRGPWPAVECAAGGRHRGRSADHGGRVSRRRRQAADGAGGAVRAEESSRSRVGAGAGPSGASLALLATALGLWVTALAANVDLAKMTDLGLMTVLPVTFWLALGAVTAAFAVAVAAGPRRSWVPPACVLALVAMLHATPAIIYGTLRYSWAWKHVAVIDYILRHGHLNLSLSQLSAYQAWPGFFVLNAVFDKTGGLASSLSYASWAPPVFEAAFALPLVLIFRRFTDDQRLIWTGVWLFYLGNWIGQDYFSPQALAYFLYLTVIAVCLRWALPDGPPKPLNRNVLVLLALPIAAIATIHQLTPMMLLSAFLFLWVFRQRFPKRLVVLAAVITIGWILIAARSFLTSNLYWIIQSIGHPDSNTTSTLVNLSKVTAGQALVANIDRALSVGIWVLAAVGVWRRRRQGRSDRPYLLLALSPLPLIVTNSYGGEMLFRVYLFALPFVALFAAASLFPSPQRGRSPLMALSVFVVSAVMLAGFAFSYYGKEQANYFNQQEVAAGQWVYTHAPPGSRLVSVTSNWPYSFEHFEQYQYDWFALDPAGVRRQVMQDPVGKLTSIMSAGHPTSAFIVFSRGQTAEVAALGLLPTGAVDRIERALLASPHFRVVYENASATVLTLASGSRT